MPQRQSSSGGWIPFVILSLIFHLVYTSSIFLIYFTSPVVHPSRRYSASNALRPDSELVDTTTAEVSSGYTQRPADRLVLIVGDGLRADTLFRLHEPSQLPQWAREDLERAKGEAAAYPFASALQYDKNVTGSLGRLRSTPEEKELVSAAPFLRQIAAEVGAWGISHTRVPTESRPGHVAMIAGMYEDVSAVTRGWKSNPLPFDSVLNQSSHAFAFGSPDIVPMFVRGGAAGKVDQYCYAEEDEDFTKDATHLDLWVLDRLQELLARARTDAALDATLRAPGTVFFLHLLGPDTTGHTFRPHSPEYVGNAIVVDAIAREVQRLFEDFFEMEIMADGAFAEHRTAYVFTADHGMSTLGNHGDGEPDNTRTPLIAWGAGVRGPTTLGLTQDDVKQSQGRLAERDRDPYYRQWGDELDHLWRADVEQADITALMASLAGLPIPANSEGRLPLEYLSPQVDARQRATMQLANARQILETYRVKHAQRKSRLVRYVPYKPFAQFTLSLPGDTAVADIVAHINNGSFDLASRASTKLIETALAGLQYLQTYDWLLLVSIVTAGYIGSMLHGVIFLLQKYILSPDEVARIEGGAKHKGAAYGPGTLLGASAFVAGAVYFQMERSPWGYTIYLAFAVYFWSRIIDQRHILFAVLRGNSGAPPIVLTILVSIGVALAALELMVIGYLERKAWTLGFLVLGVAWPAMSFDTAFRAKHKGTLLLWALSCVATALFTLGKTDKDESIALLGLSGVVCLAFGLLLLRYPTLMIGPTAKEPDADAQRKRVMHVLYFELAATVVSTIVTTSSAWSLQRKNGLPLLNQVTGWVLLVACLTVPLYTLIPSAAQGPRTSYDASRRLAVLIFAFPPIFILLSLRDETLFFVSYTLTLLAWVKVEVAVSEHDRGAQGKAVAGNSKAATAATPSSRNRVRLRTSLTYLFLLHVGFFGTGNVASISSFYLSPVYRLVPVFHPFTMAALLILKIQIPFIVLACVFHLLCVAPVPAPTSAQEHPKDKNGTSTAPGGLLIHGLGHSDAISLVQASCLCTDVLALSFLFAVRTEGSWLEIGRTITHFVMANLLHVFMLALAVLAAGVVGNGDKG